MRQQPFASPREALEHHGVKGMRWGVRNDETSDQKLSESKVIATNNANTKAYMAAAKEKASPKQVSENFKQDHANFVKKFEPPEDGKKHLTSTQKKLIIGGAVGVGVVGGLYLAKKYGLGTVEIPKFKPGTKISVEQFHQLRLQSQFAALDGKAKYITDASFRRSAFEIPAGHTFHRLSYGSESEFGHVTYATHSIADFHRYVAGGFAAIHEIDMAQMHHVSWKTSKAVKVPALTEVLDVARGVLAEEQKLDKHVISPNEVVEAYSKWSSGGWADGTGYGGGRKLIEALKAKGYGALIDEGDAGIFSESPLVFFDNGSAGPKSSTLIGKQLVETAKKSLTEISNRKP